MEKGYLHSLIPLADYKTILGIDDRDDAFSQYCLVTATHSIEQYCRRRLFRKKHVEILGFSGNLIIPLKEYPVRRILEMYRLWTWEDQELIDPELYRSIPDCGVSEDIPFCIELSPRVKIRRQPVSIKVQYAAGYRTGEVPADLATACLELAAWNMARFRGKKIGVVGSGKTGGEQLEASMPENVRGLLESYQRKMI
ncbi:hypothetical protein LQZ19_07955 [Treponema primitia]|uniref:hypothetical protein n=1 Tax=Treponema primitia TaxID=88058 RepID=UPI0039809AAA